MPFLDQIIGGLTSGGQSPVAGALMELLGGGQHDAGAAQQNTDFGVRGGVGGLLSAFQGAGLGHIAESWIGNGPNQPVSPDQLQSVFGQERVATMASRAGMEPQGFLSQLSQHLPRAVDAMTPDGQQFNEGTVSV